MIRILHVVTRMDRAGQETFIMNLYRHIDKTQIQFDFLCTSPQKGDFDEEIRSLGGKIYCLPENIIKIPHLHNLGIILCYKNFFTQHPEYQIIHFHNYHAFSVLVQLIGAKLGKVQHIIVHSHNTFAPNPNIHKIIKPLLNIFNIKRFACSAPAGKWMFGNTDYQILNNGIEIENYIFNKDDRKKFREEIGVDESVKLICHIGRFNYQKNHKFLIDIYKDICSFDKDIRLLLIGRGELEEEIRKYAHALGILDQIIFCGIRADIPAILSGCDLFILPSLFEGLGIVLIEAQTNGIPVICSDTIPSEAILCNNVEQLSLNDDKSLWIKTITKQINIERKIDNYQLVEKGGYSINDTANQLTNIYKYMIINK